MSSKGNHQTRPLCREFSSTGRCNFGERCRFRHEVTKHAGTPSTSTSNAILTNNTTAPSERKKPCYFFSAGRCNRGGQCKFSHDLQVPLNEAKQAEREANISIRRAILGESTLVTFAAGLDIRHIVCGFDCCHLTIRNLPHDVKRPEIEELFAEHGAETFSFSVIHLRTVNGKIEARVIIDTEMGEILVAVLDGTWFKDEDLLDVYINNDAGPNKMDSSERNVKMLTVTWKLPSVMMIADYDSASDAQNAVSRLDNTIFSGRKIKATLFPSYNAPFGPFAVSVKISGLPASVSLTELQRHACAVAANNHGPTVLFDSKNLERDLRRRVQHIRGFETFEMSPQNPNKIFTEARIRFSTREVAEQALHELNGKRLPEPGYPLLRAWLPKANRYTIKITVSQYNAQRICWDSIAERDDNKAAFVRITNNGTHAFICVLGDDKKVVGQLKVRVENLVAGETLDGSLWHRSFLGTAGQRFLEDAGSRTKTYVRSDWKTKSLKLYADGRTKEAVLKLIKTEVEKLEASESTIPIARRAVGFFMRKGLSTLKRELGDDAVILEMIPTPRLIIRGGEEAHRIVDRLLEESGRGSQSDTKNSEGTCPVCFDDDVSSPVLLGCSHVYCSECISHYLLSASERKQFPLVCTGDEDKCKRPIAIPVIQRFLSAQQFEQLLEAAVAAHIEKQPNKFQYCTTADCKQVYRCDGGRRTLTCPSCFASVCTACNKDAHEGMTCDERDLLNDPEEQERRTEQWALMADAKRCPSCRVWIQKTEGCNHMTCRCGSHLCWICLEVFREPNATYEHLRREHGGIYNNEAPQQQRVEANERADFEYALRLQRQFDNEGQRAVGQADLAQANAGVAEGPNWRMLLEERQALNGMQREERALLGGMERRAGDIRRTIGEARGRIQVRLEETRIEEARRAEEARRMIQAARRLEEMRIEEARRTEEARRSWCVIM